MTLVPPISETRIECIEREAREWLLYLYSDEATESGREGFESWLQRSTAHATTYRQLEQAFRDLAMLHAVQPIEITQSKTTRSMGGFSLRRVAITRGAVAATVAFGAFLVTFSQLLKEPTDALEFASPIGEVNQFGLPDGSVVTLDTGSRVKVTFDRKQRHVSILKGRAFFEVAFDPNRLFLVEGDFGDVLVTGTKFDVWKQDEYEFVGVTEGEVRVRVEPEGPLSAQSEIATVSAGEAISISPLKSLSELSPYNPNSSEQWREGRLIFLDEKLGDVLAVVNRYRKNPIQVVDEEILDFSVTIAINIDSLEDFYVGLERILPVTVSHIGSFTYLYSAT